MSSEVSHPSPGLEAWIAEFVEPGGPAADEEILAGALAALERALGLPPDSRQSAFALLAADALLTTACRKAADHPDPGARLEEILERIGHFGLDSELSPPVDGSGSA